MTTTITSSSSATTTLILRQDMTASSPYFTNQTIQALNTHDSNAKMFSRLAELEHFRAQDGTFHFKLCYPELQYNKSSSSNKVKNGETPCVQFKQQSHPNDIQNVEADVQGLELISIPSDWKGNGNSAFVGLRSDSSFRTFYDCNKGIAFWWYAVGLHTKYGSKGMMPVRCAEAELSAPLHFELHG